MRLLEPIRTLVHNATITIIYQCHTPHTLFLRVAVHADVQEDDELHAFETVWTCSGLATTKLRKKITLTFPPRLAFRPSYWNTKVVNVRSAFIYTWAIEQEKWNPKFCRSLAYDLGKISSAQIIHLTNFAPPYQRADRPITACYSWWVELGRQIRPYSPVCQKETGKDLLFISEVHLLICISCLSKQLIWLTYLVIVWLIYNTDNILIMIKWVYCIEKKLMLHVLVSFTANSIYVFHQKPFWQLACSYCHMCWQTSVRQSKWPSAITRLPVSGLVICKLCES